LLEIKDIVLENILAKNIMTDVFLSTYTLTEGNGLEGVYIGGYLKVVVLQGRILAKTQKQVSVLEL